VVSTSGPRRAGSGSPHTARHAVASQPGAGPLSSSDGGGQPRPYPGGMATPRCPAGLSARGKRAWAVAIAAVDDPERYQIACADYARAVDRSEVLQRAWERDGRPGLAKGGPHGAVQVRHPLLGALEAAEKHTHDLATSLGLTPDGHRKVKPRMGRPKEIVPPLPRGHLRPVK
jgi:phage terminase small subunit